MVLTWSHWMERKLYSPFLQEGFHHGLRVPLSFSAQFFHLYSSSLTCPGHKGLHALGLTSSKSTFLIWFELTRGLYVWTPGSSPPKQARLRGFWVGASLALEGDESQGWLGELPSPHGSDGKASTHNAGDLGSIPGSGRSLGEGNGNPLQYSCLENPMDGGAW